MANKLDLLVSKGSSFDQNTNYELNFDIANTDTSSVALSSLEVVSYGWMKERIPTSTATIVSAGVLSRWAILNSFQGQNGIQVLNMFNTSYRVYHATIDPTKVFPMLSLNIPAGGSSIGPISYTEHTATYFDIALPDSAPTLGYSISWYLPAYTEDATNGSSTTLLNPTVTFEKIQESISNGFADTKIIVSWPGSTQSIPTGYKIENVIVSVPEDSSTWYTQLDSTKKSNKTLAIYQSGVLVTEYVDSATIDPNTGVVAPTVRTVTLSAAESVYISSQLPNPLKVSATNKDDLIVTGQGASPVRSLVKFNINTIPQTTKVSKAILRLNPKYSGSPSNITIGKVTESWTEYDATWVARKNGVVWSTNGGSYTSPVTKSVSVISDEWIDFDITDIVEDWRYNGSNNGLMLTSDGNATLTSSRVAGTPVLIVYSSTDVLVKTKNIEMLVPSDASIYSSSDIFTVTVSASPSVTSVSAYSDVNGTIAYLGTMTAGAYWTKLISIGSVITSGSAQLYAVGTAGAETYTSEKITVAINALPTFTPTNTVAILSAGESFTLSATVFDKEGYNACPVTLNGTFGVVNTSADQNGLVVIPLTVINGESLVTAVVTESNPDFSTEFSSTDFNTTVVRYDITMGITGQNAEKNGVELDPPVKVVGQTFIHSTALTVSGGSYTKRYLLKKDGILVEELASTSATITTTKSGLYDVVVELTVAGVSKEILSKPVYIRQGTVDFNITGTACSGQIRLEGTVQDSDIPNSGIDNIITVGLYQNDVFIEEIELKEDNSFSKYYSPAVGLGHISVRVLDGYMIETGYLDKNIGRIYPDGTHVTLEVLSSNVTYNMDRFVGVSGLAEVTVSATSTMTDITNYLFVVTDMNGNQTITNTDVGSITYRVSPRSISRIDLTATTLGGCVYTDSISIFDHFATTVITEFPTQPNCYCSQKQFNVISTIDSIGIYQDKFAEGGLTYTQYISGSFNSTLIDSETIVPDGKYIWAFGTSATTADTSATIKIQDTTGKTYLKTYQISPAITQTPVMSFTSPVSSVIYKTSDIVALNVVATSGSLQTVKYYINDTLISIKANNFEYTWDSVKPANTYTLKAIGTSPTGCETSASLDIIVSDGPLVKIVDKIDTKYIAPGVERIKANVYSNVMVPSVFYKDGGNTNHTMSWSTDGYWYYDEMCNVGFGSKLIKVYAVDSHGTSGMDSYTVKESSRTNVVLTAADDTVDLTETVSLSATVDLPYLPGYTPVTSASERTGTITDPRDGKVYRTVKMPDGKWWLAEDVVYAGTTSPAPGYYTWAEALVAVIPGCRMPKYDPSNGFADWGNLLGSIPGGSSSAGLHLKIATEWAVGGIDDYGFGARPKGRYERSFNQPGPWYFTTGTTANQGTLYFYEITASTQYFRTAWFANNDNDISTGTDLLKFQDQYGGGIRISLRLIVESGNVPDIITVDENRVEKLELTGDGFTTQLTLSSATSASSKATIQLPAYFLGTGTNYLYAYATDNHGIVSQSNLMTITVSFTGTDSKPLIRNVLNIPETKISTEPISATFEITDSLNGINQSSIGCSSNTSFTILGTTSAVNGYYLTVEIKGSGYLEVSATNNIGTSSSYRFNNYVLTCSSGRHTNLTRYLPEFLREDNEGNNSETFDFLGKFEQTLNSLYSNLEGGCNLSVLEKTSRLQKLHDIDTIDRQHIPNYSNLLGYKSGINAEEIGTFGYFPASADYSDTTEEYMAKALRFVVRNLPNWYSIKTTRNSLKIMLLSFGIIGDIVDYYTTDYKSDWYTSKQSNTQIVDETLPTNAYPTPHMSIGIDLSRTINSDIYGNGKLSNVIAAMESIRPANVVVEGVTGYMDEIMLPGINLAMSFTTSVGINVEFESQINKQ